jgi:hypothetical protein
MGKMELSMKYSSWNDEEMREKKDFMLAFSPKVEISQ